MEFSKQLLDRLEKSGVVAGFSVSEPEQAVPICRALLEGGIDVIELTLRSPAAMEGLRAVCADVPEMLIGVGTILTAHTLFEVKQAGAHFGVAPGLNSLVVHAAREMKFPFAPGICTPTELESAIELGCRFVKLFPAEAMGGVPYLKSMAAPYAHLGIKYFPLGGVNPGNLINYLREPMVPVVGGSWIVKKDLVEAGNWDAITEAASAVRAQIDEMGMEMIK